MSQNTSQIRFHILYQDYEDLKVKGENFFEDTPLIAVEKFVEKHPRDTFVAMYTNLAHPELEHSESLINSKHNPHGKE